MRFLHRNRKICSRFYGGDVKSAISCSPNPSVPLVLLLQPHVYADFTFKVKIMGLQRILWMELRYARPRTRRHGESPVGDWRRRFHGRLRGVASTAVKSPSPTFGFHHAAGREKRPSPHTKLHEKYDSDIAPCKRPSPHTKTPLCGLHGKGTGCGI